MSNIKKAKLSQLLAYLCAAFSVLSLPFLFAGYLNITDESSDKKQELAGVVRFFRFSGKGDDWLKALFGSSAMLLLAVTILAVFAAVFVFFNTKASKISSVSLLAVAMVTSLVTLLRLNAYIAESKNYSVIINSLGYGSYLNCILLSIAFGLAAASAVLFISSDSFEKTIKAVKETGVNNPPAMSVPVSPAVVKAGKISFLLGQYTDSSIPVEAGDEIIIGKDPSSCSIVIDQSYRQISRRHCSIKFDAAHGAYQVTDLSSNGVYKEDGSRLPKNVAVRLERGTILILAKTNNIIRLD